MAEPERQRHDRELIELLNELRVALPGVQVLFGFLLTIPFARRFPKLTSFDRGVYFATLLATALATALLIAPSAYHRLRFRQHDKERMLRSSNRMTVAGIAALAVALTASIWLIGDFLFGGLTAAVATAASGLVFAWFWYGLPLSRRVEDEH